MVIKIEKCKRMFSFLSSSVKSGLVGLHFPRREVVFLSNELRYCTRSDGTEKKNRGVARPAAAAAAAASRRTYTTIKSFEKQRFIEKEKNYRKYGSSCSSTSKLLVTGASGQVGQELVPYLRNIYGNENVIATDIRNVPSTSPSQMTGPFVKADVLDSENLSQIVEDENIDTVVHLAAILSAKGEKDPQFALELNNGGTHNILNAAREYGLKVFCPSTIGVFGPDTPKENTPDNTIMRPTTVYGISKVYMELLGEYYHRVFGVDFRSLRYPGVISSKSEAGGGTTDYAVEIFPSAIERRRYTCFLRPNAALPMIYMPDLLRATSDIIGADSKLLKQRVYNLGAMSFTPSELGECIQNHIPEFELDYDPDFRQKIADTWPKSLDYSMAERDWGWRPDYDLEAMTEDIISEYLGDENNKLMLQESKQVDQEKLIMF